MILTQLLKSTIKKFSYCQGFIVFSEGLIAKEVWRYFASMCGIMHVGSSLRARIVAWWMSSPRQERRRLLITMMPGFICWHIGRVRNGAVFEGTRIRPDHICRAVLLDITSGLEIHFNIKLGWVSLWRPHFSLRRIKGYRRNAYPTLTRTQYNSSSNLKYNANNESRNKDKKSFPYMNIQSYITSSKYIHFPKIYNFQNRSSRIHSKP